MIHSYITEKTSSCDDRMLSHLLPSTPTLLLFELDHQENNNLFFVFPERRLSETLR